MAEEHAIFEDSPAKYRQRFLECKSWGHTWKHHTDFHLIRNTRGEIIQFTRQTVCTNCRSERHDVFDRRMSLVSRAYHYPDGYRTKGDYVIGVSTARSEFVRRLLVKAGDAPVVTVEQEDEAAESTA